MGRFLRASVLLAILSACNSNKTEQHAYNPDGSHTREEGLAPLSYTLYTDKSELFVEFKPLVVGRTSKFAAHLTKLGDNFKPFTEGTVTVSLIVNDNGIRNESNTPSSPGIFRLALQPTVAGTGKLVFDIVTREFTDNITIDSVIVYCDEQTAKNNQPKEEAAGDISFLKEQAWKIEFANAPVQRQSINDVVKTTGQITGAPGDEIIVAAKSTGIVKFTGSSNVIGAPVRAGQSMFAVAGGDVTDDNIDAAIQQARAELNTAKSEYDRANELVTDKLITQRQFEDVKLRYENGRIRLNNLTKNYGASGKNLSSPINGFVKNILVSEGQYVTAGQPLATITKNRKLVLRADVSLKDAGKIIGIKEANFTIIQSKQTYNTKALNAGLISIAKTTNENSPYIPVHFEMDAGPGIIPGSFAEVYLKTAPIENVLAIPVSALIEEQGIFFVYVQTAGESFQKREVKLGVNDGEKVQVVSGLNDGERIVTKGAYQVKLASLGGAMPAHGHEH